MFVCHWMYVCVNMWILLQEGLNLLCFLLSIRALCDFLWVCVCKLCYWSNLTIKFQTQFKIAHSFNKIYVHQTDLTPDIIYSIQANNINRKISAFRCIPARSAEGYINQFVALPKAMQSHSVYLNWMSIRVEGTIGKIVERENFGCNLVFEKINSANGNF